MVKRIACCIFGPFHLVTMRSIKLGVIVLAALIWSCNGRLHGNGEFVDETRNVPDYTEVTSAGNFDVFLTNDATGVVRLHGESNVLPHVETVVDGNMLMVSFEEGFGDVARGDVRVYVPAFGVERVTLQGTGSVVSQDTLDTPGFSLELAGSGDAALMYSGSHLFATISGTGNIDLVGRADEATHAITGSGKIDATKQRVHKCNVMLSGFGDAIVYADSALDATISGSGNVLYTGDPKTVTRNVSGSGSVKPR